MRRASVFALFLALAVVPLAGCGGTTKAATAPAATPSVSASPSPSTTVTYRDVAHGFSFEYPAGATVLKGGAPSGLFGKMSLVTIGKVSREVAPRGSAYWNLSVGAFTKPPPRLTTTNAYQMARGMLLLELSLRLPTGKHQKPQRVEIGGLVGCRTIVLDNRKGQPHMQFIAYVLGKGKGVFRVVCATQDEKDWAKCMPVFVNFLSSIRLFVPTALTGTHTSSSTPAPTGFALTALGKQDLSKAITALRTLYVSTSQGSDFTAVAAAATDIAKQFAAAADLLRADPPAMKLAKAGETFAAAYAADFRHPTQEHYQAEERARKAYNRALAAAQKAKLLG